MRRKRPFRTCDILRPTINHRDKPVDRFEKCQLSTREVDEAGFAGGWNVVRETETERYNRRIERSDHAVVQQT
jgi:hypothetical protein